MAKEINGKWSGTIGEFIYYIDPLTGKQLRRHRPKRVRNPKTALQKTHRDNFKSISHLSSCMTEAHVLGLQRHARRMKLRTYNDFRRLNKDCFTPDGDIDYPHIVLSHGSVSTVDFTPVNTRSLVRTHTLHLTFDPVLMLVNAHPDDKVYLYAYCPSLESGILFPPVLRTDGAIDIALPDEWFEPASGKKSRNKPIGIHLYAFLLNRNAYASNTIYISI